MNEVLELASNTYPQRKFTSAELSIVTLNEGKNEQLSTDQNFYFIEKLIVGFPAINKIVINDTPTVIVSDTLNDNVFAFSANCNNIGITAGTSNDKPVNYTQVYEPEIFANTIVLDTKSLGIDFSASLLIWILRP